MAFDPNTATPVAAAETMTAGGFDPNTATPINAPSKQSVTAFEYIANEARKGTTDLAVLGQAILDTFVIDPVKKTYSAITGTPDTAPGGIVERFGGNIQRLQRQAGAITGAKEGLVAPDELSKFLGAGARFATDPTGLIGVPIKSAAAFGKEAAVRIPTMFGIGVTSEAGGRVGEEIEKVVTGEDTGAGRAIGATVAGLKGASVVTPIVTATVKAPLSITKQVYDKYKTVKADPDSASQQLASTSAKRLLEAVVKEQGIDKIDDVVEDFNRISQSLNKEDLPLMFAMSDNPLVRVEVQRLAKTNPAMRQRMEAEFARLSQSIDERADLIFGARYSPVAGAEQVSVQNAIKRRQLLDDKIDELASRYVPGESQASLGQAIETLVSTRLKEVTKEMEPVYKSILDDAKKAGATLPDTAVRDVYNFVVANNIRDIFGKGTAVDKQIMNTWGPRNGEFFPASFNEVDSLKRRINQLQRGKLNRDEARKLDQLETVLDEARKSIPGNFSERLRAADLAYYEKVGVPFGAQGIKDIDSKKYAEQVAPVIARNESSLKQFLAAVGDEGKPVARNAIISDVYNKAFKDGVLEPALLKRYITKNENMLNQVPEVKRELQEAAINIGSLNQARKSIDDAVKVAEKELADNFVIKVKDSQGQSIPDYRSIVDRIIRDPAFDQKINREIKNLDPASAKAVRNAMRAELVDIARNNSDGGIAFLTNPRNKRAIENIFGSGYQSAVKDLVKLSDAVNKADVNRLTSVITQQDLDKFGKYAADIGFPGLDIPYVTSTIRDRISSVPQKVVRILTRVNTAKTRQDTDEAIFELLSDPQGLKKLQAVAKEFDFKVDNPLTFKKINDSIANITPFYAYGAIKASVFEPETGRDTSADIPMGEFVQ